MRDKKGRLLKGKKPKEFLDKLAKGMQGNQNATKLHDEKLKQEAYRQYCAHIASGIPKEAWYFDHPTDPLLSLTSKTMEKYIRENPADFPAILKEKAESQSYNSWFKEGQKLMKGEYKNGSPVTWQTIMRNKFGWDKEQKISHTFKPEVERLLEGWDKDE